MYVSCISSHIQLQQDAVNLLSMHDILSQIMLHNVQHLIWKYCERKLVIKTEKKSFHYLPLSIQILRASW